MKLLTLSAAVAALALVLTACAGAPPEDAAGGEEKPASTKTDAVVATTGEIRTLDPTALSTAFTSGGDRATAVYGSLMKYDEKGGVVPAMADSLESDDLTVWTLTLREGVTFTDGTAYDADAVMFNLERHRAADSTSPAKSLMSSVDTIEVVDPLTLEFTLIRPSGSFPSLLTNNTTLGYIGSPAAYEADPEGFATEPVGAGPFVMKEWVRDSHMLLEANPDYWDADNVALTSLRFNSIADTQTRTQALMSKALDMAPPLQGSEWLQFRDNDDFTIYLDGSLGAQSFYPNVSRGPMADPDVRRAVQMGIDPKSANTVLNADAIEWDGNHDCIPFAPDTDACSPGAYPDADVDEAKRIIADYAADGGDMDVRMLSTVNQKYYHDYFELVLTELGFTVEVVPADLTQFAGQTVEGNYDVIVALRLPFVSPFPAFFNQISNTGSNYLKHEDTQFQSALEAARDAAPADQAAAWGEVNKQIGEKGYAFWVTPSSNRAVSVAEFHPGNDLTIGGGGVWYPADAYFR